MGIDWERMRRLLQEVASGERKEIEPARMKVHIPGAVPADVYATLPDVERQRVQREREKADYNLKIEIPECHPDAQHLLWAADLDLIVIQDRETLKIGGLKVRGLDFVELSRPDARWRATLERCEQAHARTFLHIMNELRSAATSERKQVGANKR